MNLYFLGSALNLSCLYMVAALGASVCIKNGEFNLGGEAQIYVGGFITAVVLSKFDLPLILGISFAFILAFIICGLIAVLSSFFKEKRNADFLFTSFIFSSAIIPFIDSLITGAMRGSSGNLLATDYILEKYRFKSLLEPSSFNGFFIVAILFCVFYYFIFTRSHYGRQLCMHGISNEFSLYVGMNTKFLNYSSAFLSGGMHGLCGAASICGMYYTCHAGFYAGMGWNSLTVCLLSNSNPLFIILSSVFMAFIISFSNRLTLIHNFGFDMGGLIQAIILFFVAFPIFKGGTKAK